MALLLRSRFLCKRLFSQSQKRHGYIVLVPEIGEDLPENNPLLQSNGLPQFNNVTIENCMAAIGKQTLDFEADIKTIEKKIDESKEVNIIQDVINPLEKLGTSLDLTWGVSKTLYIGNSSLMPTKSYLAIHDRARRARVSKYSSLSIYNAAKEGLKKDDLNIEERRVLEKFILEGKLNGLILEKKKRLLLESYLENIMMHRGNMRLKLETVTGKFKHNINDEQLVKEFPESLKAELESFAKSSGSDAKWCVSLQPHIREPFMAYCPDRELRFNVWNAYYSRGSGYGDREFHTSKNIEEIRYYRKTQAKLLGFDSYAEMSMQTKMAGNLDDLSDTLDDLLQHARPAQERELKDLHEFAVKSGFPGEKIEFWDLDYWRRKQRRSLYDYDEEKLQEYFPLPKVLEGLFNLTEMLFDVKIRQRQDVSTWHKDVRYYDVFESHSAAPVAGFYFDPYVRTEAKMFTRQNNGWMVGIQNSSMIAGVIPLAALVFNFQSPTANKPSLLTFKDLQVLFHKFGQTLQHILSRTTYSEVSGQSNIEWDAVDVAGQVMSMWLYNKKALESISSHYLSEDKLPPHMVQSLDLVRKHGAGMDLSRELYLAALDLEIFSTTDFWLEIVRRLWPKYMSLPLIKTDSHCTNFREIFVEEWGAAYYSHTWSKMIAADVYSAFHEVEGQEKEVSNVGKRFRDTYLALGGSCHSSLVFRNFRGRDPSPKALLASLGLKMK